MPSSKDPKSTVAAGPGKLPAGVVPATSLLFPSGGGSGAALGAHIANPTNAHMAGAIGIPATYPVTGAALLASAGGPIDGDDVLDFIDQMKDLLPIKPNALGYAAAGVPNSGAPNWGTLASQTTGGWTRGGNVVFSHYLLPSGTASFALSGTLYPADRGVLALYSNTDGNFFNSAATTLVAALWLGSSPAPAGIPSANFVQANRTTSQTDYTAAATGLDLISLTNRLPYLSDYSGHGGVYADYDLNFYAYQLATYSIPAQTLASGDAGSYLLVHWRETFATSLAAIQPAGLTVGNLVAANAYSGVPASSNFDTGTVSNVNRRNVFVDAGSGSAPAGDTFTTAAVGTPTTVSLSGVGFYSNGATDLNFNLTVAATDLFGNSYETDATPDGTTVPTGFGSANYPITIDFSDFGGSTRPVAYHELRPQGGGANYGPANPPGTGAVGEYVNTNLAIVSPSSASPVGGAAYVRAQLRSPFAGPVAYADATPYLYNSYPQTTSTSTVEPFVDEQHRYISSFTAAATGAIIPAGGNVFDSATPFVATGGDLQVIGGQLVYPQTNFASYSPAGPNYAAVQAGEASNHPRRYVRAFDTGTARNTGTITLTGIAASAFQVDAAYDGTETTGHFTGGAIVQIKIPGVTGWLDLGRDKGDPDLGTQDFKGCSTGVTSGGGVVTVTYDTTAFTVNNGGEFPIFVRVTFLNSAAGLALALDAISWTP